MTLLGLTKTLHCSAAGMVQSSYTGTSVSPLPPAQVKWKSHCISATMKQDKTELFHHIEQTSDNSEYNILHPDLSELKRTYLECSSINIIDTLFQTIKYLSKDFISILQLY